MTTVSEAFIRNTQEMNSNGDYIAVERVYFVFAADDEEEAFTALYDAIPATYQGVRLSKVALDERINETTWKFSVTYQNTASSAEGGTTPSSTTSFDTTGGTQTIYQSKYTSAYPSSAPDLNNAIGWNGESVNGVDIVVPRYTWTETHYFTSCSTTYLLTLAQCTGCVNASTFRGFAGGEVLFMGARGQQQSTDDYALWEVQFVFQYSQNEEFQYQVGGITVGGKNGWNYQWVEYEEDLDTTEKKIIAVPKYVRIERVYDEIAFSQLGI